MTVRPRHRAIGVAAAALLIAAFPSTPSADHAWGTYHWARTSNPFDVDLGDNVSAVWDASLRGASLDWSVSTVLDTFVVPGGARNKQCRPTAGRVEVCNSTYGNNGWLGIAQIWASGSHITQGTVKMNDTYFNTAQYNTPAWRALVVCQEVGHTFGLDHQNENFNNQNLGTCMDYTSDPDGTVQGQLSNLHPNAHDYDELEIIYSHLDTFSTGAAVPPGRSHAAANPSEWGQLMKVAHGGKTQIFERDFGNGQIVVTFVIWA